MGISQGVPFTGASAMYSRPRFERGIVWVKVPRPPPLDIPHLTGYDKDMPIAICAVHEVPAFANVSLDHIVSFHNSTEPGPNTQAFRHPFTLHSFVFDDTGDTAHPQAPTEDIVRRLLHVYTQVGFGRNVLFHCMGGVSRSTAAAFIWLVYHGMSYADAYQHVVNARGPFVCPNQLMVKLADQLMGKLGSMHEFVVAENVRRVPDRAAFFKEHGADAHILGSRKQ